MDFSLMYEDLPEEDVALLEDTTPPLLSVGTYECETCGERATIEWVARDEDGLYITFTCDAHPVRDLDYRPEELA